MLSAANATRLAKWLYVLAGETVLGPAACQDSQAGRHSPYLRSLFG